MVSNLPSIIGINFAERLMYIPSAFLCILAAMALTRLPRRAAMTAVAVVALLFAMRTITYAWEWNDRLRLYARSADEWPVSVRVKILLAEEWAERNNLANASRIIAEARDVQPDYYKAWLRSATIALQAGNLEDALRFACRAHELQPTIGSAQLISELRQRLAATRPAQPPPATTRSATTQPPASRLSASQAPH
jgi:tetratricopeptide (TPR) repeat protein